MPRWLYRLLYRIGAWQIGPNCEFWAFGYRQWRWDWATARSEIERKLRVIGWDREASYLDSDNTHEMQTQWLDGGRPRRDVATRKAS